MRMRAQEEPREDQAYTLSRSMEETDAAEICADADEEVLRANIVVAQLLGGICR